MDSSLAMLETATNPSEPELPASVRVAWGMPMPAESSSGEPMVAPPGFMPVAAVRLPLEHVAPEEERWLPTRHEDGQTRVVQVGIPRLEWPVQHSPVLTDRVLRLLRVMWAIVVSRALQTAFPLDKTVVSVFHNPADQEGKAVLRLYCPATMVQALAFWDSLEPDLQSWLAKLSDNDRTTFITRLALRVHWR